MKEDLTFNCNLKAVPFAELSESEMQLVNAALDARKSSHSPYSNFQVGAALRLENQQIVSGSNQENAAYPSGLCAERVALFAAGAQHPNVDIESLAVCVKQGAPNLPFPCGGCLQVMSEYEHKQDKAMTLYLIHPTKDLVYRAQSTRDLLPFGFNESHLPD